MVWTSTSKNFTPPNIAFEDWGIAKAILLSSHITESPSSFYSWAAPHPGSLWQVLHWQVQQAGVHHGFSSSSTEILNKLRQTRILMSPIALIWLWLFCKFSFLFSEKKNSTHSASSLASDDTSLGIHPCLDMFCLTAVMAGDYLC